MEMHLRRVTWSAIARLPVFCEFVRGGLAYVSDAGL